MLPGKCFALDWPRVPSVEEHTAPMFHLRSSSCRGTSTRVTNRLEKRAQIIDEILDLNHRQSDVTAEWRCRRYRR